MLKCNVYVCENNVKRLIKIYTMFRFRHIWPSIDSAQLHSIRFFFGDPDDDDNGDDGETHLKDWICWFNWFWSVLFRSVKFHISCMNSSCWILIVICKRDKLSPKMALSNPFCSVPYRSIQPQPFHVGNDYFAPTMSFNLSSFNLSSLPLSLFLPLEFLS